MPPQTRSLLKREVIVVHDSDSDSQQEEKNLGKRRKTDALNLEAGSLQGVCRTETKPKSTPKAISSMPKNSHLRGRKRFKADLQDIENTCPDRFECKQLRIQSVKAGEDEGSFEVKIYRDLQNYLSINLLISDSSEYPDHHTFFAFSPDTDVPIYIQEVIEDISSRSAQPIEDTVGHLLSSISKKIDRWESTTQESQTQELDEDYDMDDEVYDFDDDEYESIAENSASQMLERLQCDFVETVASNYRPGFIRFGHNNFAISVSIPVITLASDIPPRALMAWDRRLLSHTQHLTLLISGFRGVYPPLQSDSSYSPEAMGKGSNLKFNVGLTPKYKPGKDNAHEACRSFGLITPDEPVVEIKDDYGQESDDIDEDSDDLPPQNAPEPEPEPEDHGRFDKFSLSSSLESLLNQMFVKVLQFRKQFGLSWAGAETLLAEVEKAQMRPEDVLKMHKQKIIDADARELKLATSYRLPSDPCRSQDSAERVNLPLITFSYLLRRLTLCARYCLVCHNPINAQFEALKPYVCDSNLCAYQYYSMNRGPSLEYEIRNNPVTVDLLVSLAYTAASEQVLDEPLPKGLGLRVPIPITQPRPILTAGPDGLCDFDELDISQMRASIAGLIDTIPPIADIKAYLDKKGKSGKAKPTLKDMDPTVLPSAWSILRWCVASCTAHLEELSAEEDVVRNIDPTLRQFRFSVGAPDAEAKFNAAIGEAKKTSTKAKDYPSLYGFHGSPLRNWHSIVRHGLWFKTIANGRAYGHGVYFAKDGMTSMGSYAQKSGNIWRNSAIGPVSCTALAELVNLPAQFTSSNPFYVVQHTEWIICRYLLVRVSSDSSAERVLEQDTASNIPIVMLDPNQPLSMGGGSLQIAIPEPSYKIEKLLLARRAEYVEEEFDAEDAEVFAIPAPQSQKEVIVIDHGVDLAARKEETERRRPENDWNHDRDWVEGSIVHLLPPPVESTPSATMALQRELRFMLKEQEQAKSLKELGWYMPPDLIGDNLFQWIVELHSFDPDLPISRDMIVRGLNSLVFEIRFPPSFPLSPPFFRIVKPRFLPFTHGGGGHVTGGGSMCMDLLTADGWLPSYSIGSILLQIKLAISNLDPRPARLSPNWDMPYSVNEALEGYKRAANTHGWKIPEGIDRLVVS